MGTDPENARLGARRAAPPSTSSSATASYILRLADNESEVRKNFGGRVWYDVDDNYRVPAKFVPYDPPRKIAIVNVLDEISRRAGRPATSSSSSTGARTGSTRSTTTTASSSSSGRRPPATPPTAPGRFLYVEKKPDAGRDVHARPEPRLQPAVRLQRVHHLPAAAQAEHPQGARSRRARSIRRSRRASDACARGALLPRCVAVAGFAGRGSTRRNGRRRRRSRRACTSCSVIIGSRDVHARAARGGARGARAPAEEPRAARRGRRPTRIRCARARAIDPLPPDREAARRSGDPAAVPGVAHVEVVAPPKRAIAARGRGSAIAPTTDASRSIRAPAQVLHEIAVAATSIRARDNSSPQLAEPFRARGPPACRCRRRFRDRRSRCARSSSSRWRIDDRAAPTSPSSASSSSRNAARESDRMAAPPVRRVNGAAIVAPSSSARTHAPRWSCGSRAACRPAPRSSHRRSRVAQRRRRRGSRPCRARAIGFELSRSRPTRAAFAAPPAHGGMTASTLPATGDAGCAHGVHGERLTSAREQLVGAEARREPPPQSRMRRRSSKAYSRLRAGELHRASRSARGRRASCVDVDLRRPPPTGSMPSTVSRSASAGSLSSSVTSALDLLHRSRQAIPAEARNADRRREVEARNRASRRRSRRSARAPSAARNSPRSASACLPSRSPRATASPRRPR